MKLFGFVSRQNRAFICFLIPSQLQNELSFILTALMSYIEVMYIILINAICVYI